MSFFFERALFALPVLAVLCASGSLHAAGKLTGAQTNCFTLCHKKIPKICAEFITQVDGYPAETRANYRESYIYNPAYCSSLCASWTDEVKHCVASADSCSKIQDHDGSCLYEPSANPFVQDPPPQTNRSCASICRKYAKCAGYGDGATQQDRQHAANSCLSECPKWSPQTIRCMSRITIRAPADCAPLSKCGLRQYVP